MESLKSRYLSSRGRAIRAAAYVSCSLVMAAISVTLWYAYGLRAWTVFAGLILLSCPVFAIIAALREERRTRRDIEALIASSRQRPSLRR